LRIQVFEGIFKIGLRELWNTLKGVPRWLLEYPVGQRGSKGEGEGVGWKMERE
jgi:hypothetical protein